MNKATRKKVITIETLQRTVIHRDSNQPLQIWCEFCQAEVEMTTPELAAISSSVGVREIFRRIEKGEVHFVETNTGEVFVCQQSLK